MRATRSPSFPLALFIDEVAGATGIRLGAGTVMATAFKSRQHATVALASNVPGWERVVVKQFEPGSEDRMDREVEVLRALAVSGIPVPEVIHVLDTFVVLQHVPGETACDVVNRQGTAPREQEALAREVAASIGRWLARFHDCFADHPAIRRRGDANLRNFLVAPAGDIAGLDFEEADDGDPATDLAGVIDSLLVTSPGIYDTPVEALGWKIDACACLVAAHEEAAGNASPPDRATLARLVPGVMRDNAARRGWLEAYLHVAGQVNARITDVLTGDT